MLQRYVGGEQRAWRVVRVPTEQVEDERNIGRELDVLMAERTMHSNRIKGLLVQQGIVIKLKWRVGGMDRREQEISRRGSCGSMDGCGWSMSRCAS